MITVKKEKGKSVIRLMDKTRLLIRLTYNDQAKLVGMSTYDEKNRISAGIIGHDLYDYAKENLHTMLALFALLGEKREESVHVHNFVDPDAGFMKNADKLLDDEVYGVLLNHYFLSTPQSVQEYYLLRGQLFVGYTSTRDEDQGQLRYITRKCSLEDFITKYGDAWRKAT